MPYGSARFVSISSSFFGESQPAGLDASDTSSGRIGVVDPQNLSFQLSRGPSQLEGPSCAKKSVLSSIAAADPGPTSSEVLEAPRSFSRQLPLSIFTTSSLPWATGTSLNPMFRAVNLAARGLSVDLFVPFIPLKDQEGLFPVGARFSSPSQQLEWIKNWAKNALDKGGLPKSLRVRFYAGRYHPALGSIIPIEDLASAVPPQERGIALLEEPEHLNWLHKGAAWREAYSSGRVVSVLHTNYIDYIRRSHPLFGPILAVAVHGVNRVMTGCYTDTNIRLSAAVPSVPRDVVINVNGVGSAFLEIGRQVSQDLRVLRDPFTKGVYFLGKMSWAKAYSELIELMESSRMLGYELPHVSVFGSGPDAESIVKTSRASKLPISFFGYRQGQGSYRHDDERLRAFSVFVNPSQSDVVATTTAEATAMGKWVIVPEHDCNEFFANFSNTILYHNADEFINGMHYALSHVPNPLSDTERNQLSWDAANDRLLSVLNANVPRRMARGAGAERRETGWERAWIKVHQFVTGNCALRGLFAGPAADLNSEENRALLEEMRRFEGWRTV